MIAIKSIYKIVSVIILTSIFFFHTSCKDDESCKAKDSKPKCEDFPDGTQVGPIKVKPNQRKAPCFHPNNSDKFIYVKEVEGVGSLMKATISSEEEEILFDELNVYSQPSWGTNNEIVFTANDLKIYALKNQSKELKLLTTSLESNYPKIYRDSLILFTVGVETVKGASGLKMIDFNGRRIDSIGVEDLKNYNTIPGLFDCEDDLVYTAFGTDNNYGIYSLNFETREVKALSIEPSTGDNTILGVALFKDDFLFYSTYRTGIFRIDLPGGKRTCIKNSCDTRSYRHLSISPDGAKILAERVDATDYREDDGGYSIESKIVIMDIDGSNERVLFE